MCSMLGRLQCHPYTLNIHFPKVANCIIIGNELELYYWNDRLNYGLGKYLALCKAVGVGGIDKFSTSVFLEKILRYY